MKLEEKLMKLRKKNAWSQEEFAEKLNVTRQTISKWELGQTVPDTDNLSKIATIFGVSVNDLLDENINPMDNKKKSSSGNSNGIKILILIIVLIVILFAIAAIAVNKVFNKIISQVTNQTTSKSVIEMFQEYSIPDIFNAIFGNTNGLQLGVSNDFEKERFNNKLAGMYSGNVEGPFMPDFLEEIIASNQENPDKIVVLKYKDTETSDAQAIRDIKNQMSKNKRYEVSYEYDEDGYINKAIIATEKLTEFAVNSFNNKFKALYFGTTNGFFMNNFIDAVILSNEENPDNIITVTYNGVTTSNADELRNMKKTFSNKTEYEISYEYDENGLINKANVVK